jgi:DNA invertase Pin-like site-specific DNA recombinase
MRVLGYARVSSKDQDLEIQIKDIKTYCDYRNFELVRMFVDKASGKNTDRTGFQDMMQALHKRTFDADAVVISKIDRIGRNLFDLTKILNDFNENHIQFISIADNIDTTSSLGKLMFGLMGSFAEYERTLINERTRKGIDEALRNGVRFGRPKKKIDMVSVRADIASGIPKTKVCKKYGVGKTYLYNKLKEAQRP